MGSKKELSPELVLLSDQLIKWSEENHFIPREGMSLVPELIIHQSETISKVCLHINDDMKKGLNDNQLINVFTWVYCSAFNDSCNWHLNSSGKVDEFLPLGKIYTDDHYQKLPKKIRKKAMDLKLPKQLYFVYLKWVMEHEQLIKNEKIDVWSHLTLTLSLLYSFTVSISLQEMGYRNGETPIVNEYVDDKLANFVETNTARTYKHYKLGKFYHIYKNEHILYTPGSVQVVTTDNGLADRLVEHLELYGEDPSDPMSIVAFHFARLDFYDTVPRELTEESIARGLTYGYDWTLKCPSADPHTWMNWIGTFGVPDNQIEKGLEWLSEISLTQLAAVCVIGRALESVNVPFILAKAKFNKKELKVFIKEIDKVYPYVGIDDLSKWFDNYLFYFNLGEKV